MPKAVLKNGVIRALEPMPPEWADGRELCVEEAADDDEDQDFDAWYQQLQTLIAQNDPNDFMRIDQAVRAADEQAKTLVRKEAEQFGRDGLAKKTQLMAGS